MTRRRFGRSSVIDSPRADRAATATVAVLAIAFALFFLLPLVGLIVRATEDESTWSLLKEPAVRQALTLSLWTSTVTVALAVALGTPIAYVLARGAFPGRAIIDALIDLPIVLPPTVAGVALLTAFGRRGIIGEPIEDWTGYTFGFTTTAVIMAQLLVAAPYYVRAARSGFESLDPQVERVAYTLGASRLRTFLRITVPQAWPALLAGLVLCWARSMGELGATLIFAGNFEGRTQTMPLAIISAFEGSSLGLQGAIVLSMILLGVAFLVLLVFGLLSRRATR
jgi:molybdate transport system permease protein